MRRAISAATHATSVSGSAWVKKSLKLKPAAEPMMMFGGSPTRVATPPMSDSKASAISKGITRMPRVSAMRIVTGAIRTIVVTLSRNIESTVVVVPRAISKSHGRPWETRPAATARY